MILKFVNKKEIKERIGAFFSNNRWKNSLVFFSFVALASVFWALQYFHEKFDFEVPMKIYYVHIPTGIALSDKLPQELTLYVQDKGSVYLNYKLRRETKALFITVDLEGVSLSNTSYVINQAALHSLIVEKLFATTQLKSYSPDKIEINYSPLAQKELPVTINGAISPASGYLFIDSIRIEPAQVVAYGNKTSLDTLQGIQTMPLNYRDIDKDWTVSSDLQAPEGIHLSVNNVKLSASVEEYTEKTFELPVICNNMPTNRNVHFFPSTVELITRVGLSKYAQLSKSNFEIAVNYNDLKGKQTANCSLILTRKSIEIESYRIVPNVIEFLIEQKND